MGGGEGEANPEKSIKSRKTLVRFSSEKNSGKERERERKKNRSAVGNKVIQKQILLASGESIKT